MQSQRTVDQSALYGSLHNITSGSSLTHQGSRHRRSQGEEGEPEGEEMKSEVGD